MVNLLDMRISKGSRGENELDWIILYNDEHWFKIAIESYKNQYITVKLSNGYGQYHMTYSSIMSPADLDETVHHILFYISNKIYRKNIAGCVWIMREIQKIFTIYPIENSREIQDYFDIKTELVHLKERLDNGETWKNKYDPKELVEYYENLKKEREAQDEKSGTNEDQSPKDEEQSPKQDTGSQNNEGQKSQKEEDQSSKEDKSGSNEDTDKETDPEETNGIAKEKAMMVKEQELQKYYDAKEEFMNRMKPDLDSAKFDISVVEKSYAYSLETNSLAVTMFHKVSGTVMNVQIFFFEDSSLPGVLMQINTLENDFEYFIPLGDRYEISAHLVAIAKDLDDFFTKLAEEETKPAEEFKTYTFDEVSSMLVDLLKEGETNLCVIDEGDLNQPKEMELNEEMDTMAIPENPPNILQLGDSDEVFEGPDKKCPEDHKPRIAVSLSQKTDEEGGAFTLRFVFPKCKNRLGSDFSFRPVYPYDHKPLLESFIKENIEILKKPCKPEKVYVPGMTLFPDDDEEDDQEAKKEDKSAPKDEENKSTHEERILEGLIQV